MKQNALQKLEPLGQSVWMDFIRRGMFVLRQPHRFDYVVAYPLV